VLNHPLWALDGQDVTPVPRFLASFGRWVHALEVNGFRPWNENRAALVLADRFGLPVVAGGDRHGLMPNALLNLGCAEDFDGYVEQIRVARRSRVLIMPEYRENTTLRTIREVARVLSLAPGESPGIGAWRNLVFLDEGGTRRPLFADGRRRPPLWMRMGAALTRAAASRPLRPAVKAALWSDTRAQGFTRPVWPLGTAGELR
jgi:hypothetical protein